MQDNIYEKSGAELICEVGRRYRDYRKRMGLTQKEVSHKSGLSVFTISGFEKGSGTGITMASFIKMLRAIDCLDEIEKILPPLPESPRTLYKKQKQRHTQLQKSY